MDLYVLLCQYFAKNNQTQGSSVCLAGPYLAVLGVVACLVLGTRVDHVGSYILGIVVLIGLFNWLIVRKREFNGVREDSAQGCGLTIRCLTSLP